MEIHKTLRACNYRVMEEVSPNIEDSVEFLVNDYVKCSTSRVT